MRTVDCVIFFMALSRRMKNNPNPGSSSAPKEFDRQQSETWSSGGNIAEDAIIRSMTASSAIK
jgi:hypothetical protein